MKAHENSFLRRKSMVEALWLDPKKEISELEREHNVGVQFGFVLRRSKYVKLENGKVVLLKKISDQELSELIKIEREYSYSMNSKYSKKEPQKVELSLMGNFTDSELVYELRKRGYDVTCKKLIEI